MTATVDEHPELRNHPIAWAMLASGVATRSLGIELLEFGAGRA